MIARLTRLLRRPSAVVALELAAAFVVHVAPSRVAAAALNARARMAQTPATASPAR